MSEMKSGLSRRGFLATACSLAASPLVTPVAFGAMPSDNRFIAIVLRGAMDALDLVQPYGEKSLATLRPKLALSPDKGLIDLDGFFGLHPAAKGLHGLWKSGELSFVQAVSTPYRDTRSHFDGQDILESGAAQKGTTGWLNRALSLVNQPARAIDVSQTTELILSGPNPAEVWSPRSNLNMSQDEMAFLHRLYAGDPVFAKNFSQAMEIDGFTDAIFGQEVRANGSRNMARMVGSLLKDRYRIASFSINGWDTHVEQKQYFPRAVTELSETIVGLKQELGEAVWRKTAIVAMTEFGRAVRENASGGTDHGTGGCCILAGGAIPGGKIFGRWPGLGEGKMLDNRDVMPTGDVRDVPATLLHRQFGIAASALNSTVFPGLDFKSGGGPLNA